MWHLKALIEDTCSASVSRLSTPAIALAKLLETCGEYVDKKDT